MWRPPGENVGLSFAPTPSVSSRNSFLATSYVLMSNPDPDCAAKAISLNGAGDQVGPSAYFSSKVILRALRPSLSMTQICAEPERPEANAICVPVGDHVGEESIALLLVSRLTPDPSRFIT